MDVESIEKLAGNQEALTVVPKDWATLNKKLKKKDPTCTRAAPMRAKKTKSSDPRSPPKLDFNTVLKREHSKVYHKTRANHEKAGLAIHIAKKLATEAARAKAAELRELREGGQFDHLL